MVSTTRPISCLTERSRSGVPIVPRKYLETTMLVACWDQKRGISTSRCSKTTEPFSLPITAERRSHSISSNGSIPSFVKKRSYSSPGAPTGAAPDGSRCAWAAGFQSGPMRFEPTAAPFCIFTPPKRESAPAPGRTHKFSVLFESVFAASGREPRGLGSALPMSPPRCDKYGPALRVVKRDSTTYCV